MSARTVKGNILKRWGECPDCGKEFDPDSFRVMVQGSGPYLSCLCRECAAKEPNVEVVENE